MGLIKRKRTDEKIADIRSIVYPYLNKNGYVHNLWYCDRVYYKLVDRCIKHLPSISEDTIIIAAYFHVTGIYTHSEVYETASALILDKHKKSLMVNGYSDIDIEVAKIAIQEHRNIYNKHHKGFSNEFSRIFYETVLNSF